MPRLVRLAAFCVVCAALVTGASLAASAADRRVYKVDSLVASVRGGMMTVEAKGAVQSGGWRHPRLRPLRSPDPRTVLLEFVAMPPRPGSTVIEALLPVTARLKLHAPPHAITVRAVGEANEVTSQVLRASR